MTWGILTELLGGTDINDGQVLYAADLVDTFDAAVNLAGSDLADGSITNSATETNIGEVIFTANKTINGVMIMASGRFESNSAGRVDSSIKLYTGTNAAFGSNTLRKTITREHSEQGITGWSIFYVLTSEETWTGNVYVQITGTNSDAAAGNTTTCETLVVVGIGGSI